jgi:hypothetical protein
MAPGSGESGLEVKAGYDMSSALAKTELWESESVSLISAISCASGAKRVTVIRISSCQTDYSFLATQVCSTIVFASLLAYRPLISLRNVAMFVLHSRTWSSPEKRDSKTSDD